MKEIRVEKVTLNVGVGDVREELEKAKIMLKKLTGKDPVVTRTHKRTTFGVAKGRPIGAKITLRGKEASEFLAKALNAVENRIRPNQFDRTGNFSFGVKEYINMPGIKYDPDIGIMGFDVTVTLERRGYRVKKRKLKPAKIGKKHVVTPEEAIEWAKANLKVDVSDEEE
ncbi:MAG: 50S ribosomal protein L5 [Candidatus Micrarchaeota archaeon]|nr:50S ribosomal protein L5 [Candidatus Micrarchaeota archaeon]